MKRGLTIRRGADYALISRFALDDPRLSWKAKGLLTFLMNMPAGEKVYWSDVATYATDGKDSLEGARRELTDSGYLFEGADGLVVCDTMPDVAGNPQVPRAAVAAFPQQSAATPVGKPERSPATLAGNPQFALIPTNSRATMKENIDGDGGEGNYALTLFGTMNDDEKETVFRKSLLGPLKDCLLIFREAVDLGIDVEHYHAAILAWSNKKNRTRRTSHGWFSTVQGAMQRDKASGRLKMVGDQASENSALIAYLNM